MNPLRLFHFLTHENEAPKLLAVDKPKVKDLWVRYVLPLSMIPCIMIALRLYNYPKPFIDVLSGKLLLTLSVELLLFQLLAVVSIAWATRNLARMVNIKASFRDSLLIVAIAATPLWLMSLFYLVPSIDFNLVINGFAVMASIALIYRGVVYIFGLHKRGAAAMLTVAIVSTASLGFAVLLSGTLISWDSIQQQQITART